MPVAPRSDEEPYQEPTSMAKAVHVNDQKGGYLNTEREWRCGYFSCNFLAARLPFRSGTQPGASSTCCWSEPAALLTARRGPSAALGMAAHRCHWKQGEREREESESGEIDVFRQRIKETEKEMWYIVIRLHGWLYTFQTMLPETYRYFLLLRTCGAATFSFASCASVLRASRAAIMG